MSLDGCYCQIRGLAWAAAAVVSLNINAAYIVHQITLSSVIFAYGLPRIDRECAHVETATASFVATAYK